MSGGGGGGDGVAEGDGGEPVALALPEGSAAGPAAGVQPTAVTTSTVDSAAWARNRGARTVFTLRMLWQADRRSERDARRAVGRRVNRR